MTDFNNLNRSTRYYIIVAFAHIVYKAHFFFVGGGDKYFKWIKMQQYLGLKKDKP